MSLVRLGFAADARGVIAEILFSPQVSRAYDIMTADGVSPEDAAELAAAAERSGRDPEAFARHFTRVRQGFREAPGAPESA